MAGAWTRHCAGKAGRGLTRKALGMRYEVATAAKVVIGDLASLST
jgi:hypothetical protein